MQMLQEELKANQHMKIIIIYHLFDNCTYSSTGPNGKKVLAHKEGGIYHIVGDLLLVDQDQLKLVFNTATPLFLAGGNNEKIIILL
jgi:hypothetical protein